MRERENSFIVLLAVGMFLTISLSASNVFAENGKSKGNWSNPCIVARIGDEKIYISEIEQTAKKLDNIKRTNKEISLNLGKQSNVRKYIAYVALAKRARREGIGKDKDAIFEIERAEDKILSNKLLSDRLDKIKITEKDLQVYYMQNKQRYPMKGKIKISYIILESKTQAEKIIDALNKGKSFEKVAENEQKVKLDNWIFMDSSYATQIEGLSHETLNELFSLDKGGSSNPVEIHSEFYIFHIDKKEPAMYSPFAEVRKQVEYDCGREAKKKAIAELIRETFAQENVKVYKEVQSSVTSGTCCIE